MLPVSRATIVIPARTFSRRIPCKPLVEIGGRPLVAVVASQACKIDGAQEVLVVTDSDEVADAVAGICDCVIETRPAWCGTQRVAMAFHRVPSLFPTRFDPASIVINWQLDEPFVSPDDVGRLITLVKVANDPDAIATLVCQMPKGSEGFVRHVVGARLTECDEYRHGKVAKFKRGAGGLQGYRRHVGVYGFSATALHRLATIEQSKMARKQDLEQIAWQEAGFVLSTTEIKAPCMSIRTPADVAAANKMLGRPKHARIDARRVSV